MASSNIGTNMTKGGGWCEVTLNLFDSWILYDTIELKLDIHSSIAMVKQAYKNTLASKVLTLACRDCIDTTDDFCFIFDDLLLEDEATLAGLGIVDGDHICVATKNSVMEVGMKIMEQRMVRTAEEISVGLNVLIGETEAGLDVIYNDSVEIPPLESCCKYELNRIEEILMPDLYKAMKDSEFKSVKTLPDFSLILANLKEAKYPHEVGVGYDFHHVMNAYEKNIPSEEKTICLLLLSRLLSIIEEYRESRQNVHECIPLLPFLLYIGPERSSNFSNYLAFPPAVQLRCLNSNCSLRDLVYSYKIYSENQKIAVPHLSYNNETFGLDSKVNDIIGTYGKGLRKHFFSFPFDVGKSEDTRLIDDLVEFIEGEGEQPISTNKKKRRKKRKPNQTVSKNLNDVSANSIQCNAQAKVATLVSNAPAPLLLSNLPIIRNEPPFSTQPGVDMEMVTEKTPSDKLSGYDEISDTISKNVEVELDAKKSKLTQLCNQKSNLERAISEELQHMGVHKQNVEDIIDSKAAEMKNLLLMMEKSEDDKNGKVKKMNEVDTELADLETRIIELKMKKAKLSKDCDRDEELIQKFGHKRHKLESYIENKLSEAKEQGNSIDARIQDLTRKLSETVKAIENLPNEVLTLPTATVQPPGPNKQLLEFIDKQISEKEKELECPVCLEVASAPIFMCSELHLICTNCRPKVKECPECRKVYEGKPKRHRYAEKTAEEVVRLRNERIQIVESSSYG